MPERSSNHRFEERYHNLIRQAQLNYSGIYPYTQYMPLQL